ncbi:hypothetical protein [Sphingomonas sp. G-3-2-10]|uniref:hypothetical protein n=1 Tax=Sphingomonas sp. G-3-2-10 TaxID=2728838 RepID=UPI00146B8A28|nr:hypothetical protein [Sphingomonas sp. G-3-2-10]NML04292.1 hypothetical protein [Sphingomonas sp. G-3-2-10]
MTRRKQITNPLTGEAKTMHEWADHLGLTYAGFRSRTRRNLPADELFAPSHGIGPKPQYVTVNGVTKSLRVWADEAGMCYSTVAQRLASGWTPEDTVIKPANPYPGRPRKHFEFRGEVKTAAEWAKEFTPVMSESTLAKAIRDARGAA